MADKYNIDRAEDTLASKVNRRLRLYRITAVSLVVLLAALAVWFYTTASVASKKALREAKDVRMAMSMLAIEVYSGGGDLFDPAAADGLAPGVAERLKELSGCDGDIVLTGWNKEERDARSFRYTSGNYVVFFQKNVEETESSWEVYLQLRVTDFG